jgi:pimeloyl-ACP methyl ester carboxylesterase
MPTASVNGVAIAYEVVGEVTGGGRPWVLTPGGRFTKESPGLPELAAELAKHGNQVLLWDRPNCGDSDVCFTGDNESQMQADALAELLRQLGMTPAVIAGGSGGARVSLLTAATHRDVAAGLAMWWISGGVFGLMSLGVHYCGQSLHAAWTEGMEAVAALDEWQEVIERNPSNRQRILDQDRAEFIATMERWMAVYCPSADEVVPGLSAEQARAFDLPTLVFRSGESDAFHTRATSEHLAAVLPKARLVEPPWGDREWIERQGARDEGLFARWPLLAPQLLEWASDALAS